MITNWLDKHGDPTIEKEVEEEAELIVKRGSFTLDSQGNITADNITIGQVKPMKYIYENDCPTEFEAEIYYVFLSWDPYEDTEHRFKPNGITDNRTEYRLNRKIYLATKTQFDNKSRLVITK